MKADSDLDFVYIEWMTEQINIWVRCVLNVHELLYGLNLIETELRENHYVTYNGLLDIYQAYAQIKNYNLAL